MVFRLPLVTVTVAALLAGVSGHDLRIKVSGEILTVIMVIVGTNLSVLQVPRQPLVT